MADANPLRLQFDAFDLDEANARLTRHGQPVTLAPRAFGVLCTLARQPGQLVTKNALLDAVWGHRHVGESALKNIVSEVRAALADDARQPRYIETASRFGYRFIALSATAANAMPTPVEPGSSPLVGREAVLARMHELWERAQTGHRQLLWIAGEAGIGKTKLIERFVSQFAPKVVAFGRCVEHYGTGEPYLPLLEVLKEICRLEPEFVTLMRGIAPTWLIQMPWLMSEAERAALHRELMGAHPDRMLRELRELMERFTAGRPIVFVLEDMHWSDVGTLRLMEHYARRPRGAPILWIATFRLTQIIAEDHPLRALRQELRAQKVCEEIVLDPFSESEVGAYLQQRLPRVQFPESFVRRLHAHTDGLPLYVSHVVDALIPETMNPAAAGELLQASADVPLPVPDSLAGVIERQLARLPAPVQRLLEAAAVCGAEFRAGTVAAMLGLDANAVRDACDGLVRSQIWLRQIEIVELDGDDFDSRYAFLHALYEHVLYQRLTLSQRVAHHRSAARFLAASTAHSDAASPAELASHHERGHETLPALRAYCAAAAWALAHFAPKDAAYLVNHARKLLPRCPAVAERDELEQALRAHGEQAAAQLLHAERLRSELAATAPHPIQTES